MLFYSSKILFLDSKLIPTMLIATCVNRRTFTLVEYTCATSVSLGLIFFAAADWKLTPVFHWFGILLVSLSVVADAILPNYQERLFSLGSSRLEVTFYTNFFVLIVMTMVTGYSGHLPAVIKLATSNQEIACYLVVYTLVSYTAISAFMMIVKEYGGVIAVLLATARKAMTLALSFVLFPEEFSWMYVLGAFLVLGGLMTASLFKQIRKKTVEDRNLEMRPILGEKCIEEGSVGETSPMSPKIATSCKTSGGD